MLYIIISFVIPYLFHPHLPNRLHQPDHVHLDPFSCMRHNYSGQYINFVIVGSDYGTLFFNSDLNIQKVCSKTLSAIFEIFSSSFNNFIKQYCINCLAKSCLIAGR